MSTTWGSMRRKSNDKRRSGIVALILVLAAGTSCGKSSLLGITYGRINCAQLACLVAGHVPASAAKLFSEGVAITEPLQPGDILAFHGGAHVAVVYSDGSLIDSTPERGVGVIGSIPPRDPWYSGPVRVVKRTATM